MDPDTGTTPVTTMACTAAESVDEVAPDAWNAVAAGASFFACHGWQRFLEERLTASIRYLLWHDGDGRLVAALPTYAGGPDVMPRPFTLTHVIQADTGVPSGFSVLGGSAYGYQNDGLLIRPDVPPRERAALARAMVGEFRSLARSLGADHTAFLCVPQAPLAELATAGYGHPSVGLMSTVATLELSFPTFDGYLGSLPARRRSEIRRERRIFRDSGLSWGPADVPGDFDEIADLIVATYQHHGYPPIDPAVIRGNLEAQARFFGEDTLVLVCRDEGRLVGAVSGFVHGTQWIVPWLGLDYEVAQKTALYFNLGYYLPIEHATRRGGTMIDFGVNALHAKVLRGMEIEPKWALVEPSADDEAGWSAAVRTHNRRGLEEFRTANGERPTALLSAKWSARAPR
ncbi:GNAT family N-acetyltransferase [Streptomyces sp. NPDC002766]|uniref:GNAT family N-acetyltransferase n=1 Tax=Streptomyces sp. NPDC002766 TaxID=3154429 RepID=UPI003327A5ED